MQQQGLGSLFTLGGAQQAQQQQVENELFRRTIEQQQEPYKRMGFFSDVLQGIPSYQQTMQQKTGAYTNPLLGAIGAGLGTYGILSGSNPTGAFGMGS
jgi:gamma-glutamyl:cysteine ligase YbdK (ATP-grasp superfamily)